jgi:hypothetical protein
MAKTKTIHRRYKALTPSVSLKYEINIDGHSVGNVPTKQTYNPTFAEFTPDYTLVPCIIFPECHIDGAAVNDQLTNVKWASLADNGTKTDILVNTPGYEVSYSGADSGLIKIKKNTPFDTTHKLLFTAEYMDARTNQIYNFREEVPIVCTSEGVALPLLEVTPCHIQYDPIDGQKDYLLTASLKVGEKMEFTGEKQNFLVQYKWYKLRNKNHEANVDDLFTELNSSDRETASSATSPSITIDASKIEDGAMYRCIAEYCSIHDSLGDEENSTIMKDVEIKRVFPSFDYQMIAPDVIDEDEKTISAEASVVANGRVLDDISMFQVEWQKNGQTIGHKKEVTTDMEEDMQLSLLVADPTKNPDFLNVTGANPYPTVEPKSTLQMFTDSQGRKYDAKGIDSVMDWDVRDKIGAKGVNPKNSLFNYLTGDFSGELLTYCCLIKGVGSFSNNEVAVLATNGYYTNATYRVIFMTNTLKIICGATLKTIRYIFNDNELYHLVIVMDKVHKKVSLYINGSLLDSSTDLTAQPGPNTMTFLFENRSGYFFSGSIFQQRLLNFAASISDVERWYNNGLPNLYTLPSSLKKEETQDIVDLDKLLTSGGDSTYDSTNHIITINTQEALRPSIMYFHGDKNNNIGEEYYYLLDCEPLDGDFIIVRAESISKDLNTLLDKRSVLYIKGVVRPNSVYQTRDIINLGHSDNIGKRLKIHSWKVIKAACLNDFSGETIQPHKWVDSGATSKDIPFIENGARIVDIEYPEEV